MEFTGACISSASLSLSGEIGVNLFIQPFEKLGDGAYLMVKGPNDTEAQKILLDESIYKAEKEAYLVSVPVYASQMGEQVKFTLYNSKDEVQKL